MVGGAGIPDGIRRAGTGLTSDVADALAAIVESSDDAIYSKDKDALLTSWNAAAERLYGYSADEAIGQPVSILIPPERRGEELDILAKIMRGEKVHHYETQRITKDGSRVDVSISVSPVHSKSGEVVEAAIISRDIRQQKQIEMERAAIRERQRFASRKQALELNDEIVQGLVTAKLALEAGQPERGFEMLSETLSRAKAIVSRLLEEQQSSSGPLRAGDFVRDEPASGSDGGS